MSKGEDKLIRILRAANVRFEREKTFSDLKGGKFRFDFYLPTYNILLEYDGQQHFKQVKLFQKNRSDFLHQQENDRRKNSYALSHNIVLIRIPYWEIDNIIFFQDLFNPKYRVINRFHNDYLVPK